MKKNLKVINITLSSVIAISIIFIFLILLGSGSKDSEKIIRQLEDKGLFIVYFKEYNSSTDPEQGLGQLYETKINFADEHHGLYYDEDEPKSGSIETFKTHEEAVSRADSLMDLSSSNLYGYQIVANNALIRLNSNFSYKYVEQYADALSSTIYSTPETVYGDNDDIPTAFRAPTLQNFIDQFNRCAYDLKLNESGLDQVSDSTYVINNTMLSTNATIGINDTGEIGDLSTSIASELAESDILDWLRSCMCAVDNTLTDLTAYPTIAEMWNVANTEGASNVSLNGYRYEFSISGSSIVFTIQHDLS